MMKKLLLSVVVVCSLALNIKAQINPTPTTMVITDTLHYYYNKFYFKQAFPAQFTNYVSPTNYTNYAAFYQCPALTFTGYPFVGNKFECPDTIVVEGLEAVLAKARSATEIFNTPARVYLCKLDANGKPKLPALDSVELSLNSRGAKLYGGPLKNGPKKIIGDYAILVRNVSTIAGDTVNIMRTSCKTFTAWPATWQEKYSDGYGFIRHGGSFYSTTNFTLAPGFGWGTDYEFFVAPRVTYTATVSQAWPTEVANSQTVCTFQPLTFTNTSSKFFTNRMFNLLEFYKKWNTPLAQLYYAPPGGWPSDSTVTWKFDFEETNSAGGKIHLPYGGGSNTIQFYTDSVLNPKCSDQNFFRVNFKKMIVFGTGAQTGVQEMIPICVEYCGGDAVGLSKNTGNDKLSVYPNPAVSGKTYISGLHGKSTILVYDVLGQVVFTETTEKDQVLVDLSNKANGSYLIKVTNGNGQSRAARIIKGTD